MIKQFLSKIKFIYVYSGLCVVVAGAIVYIFFSPSAFFATLDTLIGIDAEVDIEESLAQEDTLTTKVPHLFLKDEEENWSLFNTETEEWEILFPDWISDTEHGYRVLGYSDKYILLEASTDQVFMYDVLTRTQKSLMFEGSPILLDTVEDISKDMDVFSSMSDSTAFFLSIRIPDPSKPQGDFGSPPPVKERISFFFDAQKNILTPAPLYPPDDLYRWWQYDSVHHRFFSMRRGSWMQQSEEPLLSSVDVYTGKETEIVPGESQLFEERVIPHLSVTGNKYMYGRYVFDVYFTGDETLYEIVVVDTEKEEPTYEIYRLDGVSSEEWYTPRTWMTFHESCNTFIGGEQDLVFFEINDRKTYTTAQVDVKEYTSYEIFDMGSCSFGYLSEDEGGFRVFNLRTKSETQSFPEITHVTTVLFL
ncbi:MAG: hypothetical protein H8D63_01875 [Parcubacteria group bacterium]|nr:hypothetical protein [Parcubacteria group bacterium]